MKLKDIMDRLAPNVELELITDDCENIAAIYDNDMEHVEEYLDNCNVKTIDTTEDGTLVLVVDDNTGE